MISPAEISKDSAGSIVMMSSMAQAMTSVSFGVAASAGQAPMASAAAAAAASNRRAGGGDESFMVVPFRWVADGTPARWPDAEARVG